MPGTQIVRSDSFQVDNCFQGGAIGLDAEKDCGGWVFNVRPSIGVGRTFTTVDCAGFTMIHVPGGPDLILPGGTYNLTSNLGEVHSNKWTVVPELDVRVSKTVWDCLRLSVGYSAIYMSNLVRAGEQIDPYVNPNLIPPPIPGGPNRPTAILQRSSAWLNGFTFGLEVRY